MLKATMEVVDGGRCGAKSIHRKSTVTQTHLTYVFKVANSFPTPASHSLKPRVSHLADTQTAFHSNPPPSTIATPTLVNPSCPNWITHWHIPQHTVIILCVGMHFQNAATEIATVTMLSRLQMCNTGPVVVIKHNARPLPHNSTPDMLTGGPPQCTLNSLNSLNNQRTAKPGSKIRSFSVSIPLPS